MDANENWTIPDNGVLADDAGARANACDIVPDEWYAVADSRRIGAKPTPLRRFGVDLVVWRDVDGNVHAARDVCPHRGAKLSIGHVDDDGCLRCPYHGFAFAGDGTCTEIPSNGRGAPVPSAIHLDAYAACEAHGYVWLWSTPGAEAASLPAPRFFDDLDGLSYRSFCTDWPVHYTRVVENQLDVAHLPFVHRSTIGSGMDPRYDGRNVRHDDDGISAWTDPRATRVADDETPPGTPGVRLKYPNTWQLYLGPKVRIVAAFYPVDATTTELDIRSYQGYVTVPGARAVADFGSELSSRMIVRQDLAVVSSQVAPGTEREHLVPADRQIAVYRAWRRNRQRRLAAQPPAPDATATAGTTSFSAGGERPD